MFLQSEKYYHIYNRANGFEKIFLKDEHYNFFLKRYRYYIEPFVNTYTYCLMSNHFHLLIQIKTPTEIRDSLYAWRERNGLTDLSPLSLINYKSSDLTILKKLAELELMLENGNKEIDEYIEKWISKQFANLFSSYTQAFNKQTGRMGSLFIKNFKRKPINDEKYLKNLIRYIHLNPVEAGICNSPSQWKYSSYNEIVKGTLAIHKEVVGWFDDLENFSYLHHTPAPKFETEPDADASLPKFETDLDPDAPLPKFRTLEEELPENSSFETLEEKLPETSLFQTLEETRSDTKKKISDD